jgi:hypothetical protein
LWTALALEVVTGAGHDGMVVIGAGQGRTGTDSLRVALNELGAGPTYHMSQLLGIDASRPVHPLEMLGLVAGHCDFWERADQNISRGLALDWGFMREHYRSSLDMPAAAYFQQLLDANPGAKVVLTTRDPAALFRSSRDTWCRVIGVGGVADRFAAAVYSLRPYGRRFFRMHAAMGRATARALGAEWEQDFSWGRVCADEAYAVAFFRAWDDRVRRAVPAGQLLEFETGTHGYEELSNFLGLAGRVAPGTPYPRTNSRAEFGLVLNIMRVLSVLSCFVPIALVWGVLRCSRRRPKLKQT